MIFFIGLILEFSIDRFVLDDWQDFCARYFKYVPLLLVEKRKKRHLDVVIKIEEKLFQLAFVNILRVQLNIMKYHCF